MSAILFILFLYFLFKYGFKLFVGFLGAIVYLVACLIGVLVILSLLPFLGGLFHFGGEMIDLIGLFAFLFLIRIVFSG